MSPGEVLWLPRSKATPNSQAKSQVNLVIDEKFGALLPQIFESRNLVESNSSLEKFLFPKLENLQSPFSISNLEKSAERLASAILTNEKIAVYGDYDMDGMSGLSLLISFFRGIGHNNLAHIQPHRFKDGYGVHSNLIRQLHEEGASVVITVDTGSMAFEADDTAEELGLTYIITDHHQCDPNREPKTPFFINPNQPSDSSQLKYLSGVGVAFYLVMGLRAKLRERKYFETTGQTEFNLLELLDLFSLGSIGDVVPLTGDNRILVKYGLERLRNTQRPGLRVLLDSVLENKPKIGARDVAFSVVPKLNSASRMGQAELSTQLLLETDPDQAVATFDKIMVLNTERSRLQKLAILEAKALGQAAVDRGDRILVLTGPWHEGILGIIAAKIADEFSRPAIVLAAAHDSDGNEILRGSMRSPSPHHSIKILNLGKELLLRFGGHQAAAGMALLATNFDAFQQIVQAPVEGSIDQDGSQLFYDGVLENLPRFHEIKALEHLEPLGAGNPEPVFLMKSFSIGDFEILKESHIKAKKSGVEFIGFSLFSKLQEIATEHAFVDLLVVPEISTFRFQERAQLRIQSIRPAIEKMKSQAVNSLDLSANTQSPAL